MRGHGVHLPQQTHQKVPLYVEKFSLKAKWKLPEGLLYNQNNHLKKLVKEQTNLKVNKEANDKDQRGNK